MVKQHRGSRARFCKRIRLSRPAPTTNPELTETIMNRIIILAALVAAPSLALSVPATPGWAQDIQSARVNYDDLDLSKDRDVRILDRRIRIAVEKACGPQSDADPAGNNEVRRCRAETLALVTAQREVAIAGARQSVRTALASQD
jgi:UrcA family protein